jgi:hypothetical protein
VSKGKPGVMQYFILSDATGDIKMSLFNEAVEKFADKLQVDV